MMKIGNFTYNDLKFYTSDEPQDVRIVVELDDKALRRMAAKALQNTRRQSRAGCVVVKVLNARPSVRP